MFDVFYMGDNPELVDRIPFAKQVSGVDSIQSQTKMYWLIEPHVELTDTDVLNYRPEDHDSVYEHIWKWNPNNYGGVRLLPKGESLGVKEVNQIVCKKSFAILNTSDPGDYFTEHPYADYVWCVDPDYKLNDNINWAPDNFEPDFIHCFHLKGQLEHKYPEREGGIKLFPKNWKQADNKFHSFLDANVTYPVLYVKNVEDYAQRNIFDDEYVWLIDVEHKVNSDTVDWVPSPFEDNMIHVFRMPYQLTEKYPMAMGGIRLVPKKWNQAETKIHTACPIEDEAYDVFYIDDDEFNADTYQELAERSKTDRFWVVDREYDFNGKLLFVPAEHEQEYIHVFKIPGHLEERYPLDNNKPWDTRCGGVRLVSKTFDMTKHKYQKGVVPVRYDVFYTDNMTDYETHARKSRTKMFWLVDAEHKISEVFNYIPHRYDQKTISVFKIPGQLEYKYPRSVTNISDNRCGGVKLVPKKYNEELQKYVSMSPTGGSKAYPVIRVKNIDDLTVVDQDGWVVDEDYLIDDTIEWSPPDFQRKSMHVFHVKGQLRHKYPDNMGGLRWVPLEWDGNIVLHGELDVGKHLPVKRVKEPAKDYKKYSSCWLVDSLYKLELDDLKWAPDLFDREMIHVFHVYNQLSDKYPEEMGGVYWVPEDPTNAEIKIHTAPLRLAVDQYPVYFADDPSIPLEDDAHWVIDNLYRIDKDSINWVPDMFDMDKIHVFHIKDQLSDKYPEEMGGAYWHPANVKSPLLKIHKEPMELVVDQYPVHFADDPSIPLEDEAHWVIDDLYRIDKDSINWVPDMFDMDKIHVFHVYNQLSDKYPEEMGGVYWHPANVKSPLLKIHTTPLRLDVDQYPVHFADDPSIPLEDEAHWVIDSQYRIDKDAINWVPDMFDMDKIHVFHIKNQLTRKYPEEMGGVYWHPANVKSPLLKIHKEPMGLEAVRYPVLRVADPTNFKVVKEDCWLVDEEYILDDSDFNVVPWQVEVEKEQVHNYQVTGQLEHKYPESMGGIYWVPANRKDTNFNIHDVTPFGEQLSFPVFDTEEEGRTKSNKNWFWVIDKDVDVDSKFDFNFVPKIWDTGKTHVWQIANPVTGLQYDYQGVKLCHINPAGGRNKYIKEIASTQKVYDILHLDPEQDILEQLNSYSSSTKMYWVIDPWVELHPDFDFSVYPTQWDQDCVHVFTDDNGVFRNVRLVPAGYEFDSLQQITNNSFTKLKEHNIIASVTPKWPVLNFCESTSSELQSFANTISDPWFFTIDPDVKLLSDTLTFEPSVNDHDRVHTWQRMNPHTREVHSYGGVRLWPTHGVENITTDQIKLNKIPRLRYVREALSVYKPYPVVLLSYHEERAQTAFDALRKRSHNALWVKDVDGIFEAHKEAAAQAGDATMFWVVDADAELADDFNFSYIPDVYDQDVVHVWASLNPVTGSKYGYGGVKLFNTSQVNHSTSWGLDFTTGLSNRFKFMPQVSCTTKFNTSAYDTWRSAFREVVKLSVSSDPDAQYRIQEWMNPIPDAEFSQDAKRGAEQAQAFAKQNINNITELDKINDYEWLKKKYKQG